MSKVLADSMSVRNFSGEETRKRDCISADSIDLPKMTSQQLKMVGGKALRRNCASKRTTKMNDFDKSAIANKADCKTVDKPRVSIGLPVYNGEAYLADTLDSLLAQSFEDFEINICDNASTDSTEEICRAYSRRDGRIRYFRNAENVGAAGNYRRALEVSTGEYFRWANADDLFESESLARCVDVLDADDSVVLTYPKTKFIDQHGDVIKKYDDNMHLLSPNAYDRFVQVSEQLGYVNIIYGLMRTEVVRKTGLLRNFHGGDILLVAELALYGKFAEIPEYLFCRRFHPAAFSSYSDDASLEQEFFDPNRKKTIPMTEWRHLCEHGQSILRTQLGLMEKARLLWYLVRMGVWRRTELARELMEAVRYGGHRIHLRVGKWTCGSS